MLVYQRVDHDYHDPWQPSVSSAPRRMLQEPEILGCLGGHPNIVQLRCAAVSQETLRIYIVMYLGLKITMGLLGT